MNRFAGFLFGIATLICASLTCAPALASSFYGTLPVGYSDQSFQIGGSSTFAININALGGRDPSLCAFCNSGYMDNFTVNFFDSAGTRLASTSATNYLYSNQFTSSHGIGAGPVWMVVPGSATTVEVISQLSIFGLLGSGGGNLNILTDGSITAATPLPGALPLFAGGFGALGWFKWRKKRKHQPVSDDYAQQDQIVAPV